MEAASDTSVELHRKIGCDVLHTIMKEVVADPEPPSQVAEPQTPARSAEPEPASRIPVPIARQATDASPSEPEPSATEVTLVGKATVTLIETTAAENTVTTLMSADSAALDATGSFTMVVESSEPKHKKVTKKNSKEHQVESVSQLKGSSRASFANPKDSVSSLAPSTAKPKNPTMNLPHKPGSLPAFMRNRPKKAEPAAEPKDLLSASSTMSRLSTAPATPMKSPSAAVSKKPAEKKPKTAMEANILSASSTLSRLSTAPSTGMAPTAMNAAQKNETLLKSNELFALKSLRLKKQVESLTAELNESTKKAKEFESALNEKNLMLKDKANRIRDLEMQKSKFQRDSKKVSEDSGKVAALETQLAALQKEKENLLKKISLQEASLSRQRNENIRLEKELKKTLDLNDQILAASQGQDKGDGGAQEKFDGIIKELRKQLKQRDAEISNLKRDSTALNEENRSLKTQSQELVKFKPGSESSRETFELKKSEDALKQEVNKLKSMLEDANHKNFRHENLLHLRGEYIKTLQETDEVNKSRLILQLKENEDLRHKVEKLRNFKAASVEELNNMKNTLDSQEREIMQLQRTVEFKDEKIQIMKQFQARVQ